jgi:hypothetical protein
MLSTFWKSAVYLLPQSKVQAKKNKTKTKRSHASMGNVGFQMRNINRKNIP